MDPVKVLQALAAIDALLSMAQRATGDFQAVIGKARAEGRDVTDAELDLLAARRASALDEFKAAAYKV